LVQNVETLAHVALIARFGADWFRTMGPASEPGSALVTVSGAVARPGVYEVALGTSLPAIVGGAGGAAGEVTALLVGGYFGTWIAGDVAASLTLDRASLGASAASVGCGAIAVLPTRVCGLAETARLARWLARETAGQCGVCVNGLAAIAGALDVLVHGDGDGRAEAMLHRWLGMVKGRGACKHPDGAVRMIESAMHTFAGEISRHRRGGPCLQSAATLLPLPRREGWR
jgi:NADH:ubiquinone oxidoreductase subunit F (NADH-binding)